MADHEAGAHHHDGPGGIPEIIWTPGASAILALIIGATGMAAGYPWLFPSLGPSIFLQVSHPELPSSRFYNVLVGQILGMLGAFFAVSVLAVDGEPPVLGLHHLYWGRIFASALALFVTHVMQVALEAPHPPAAATALLISLGSFHVKWGHAVVLLLGFAITAILGEGVRRLGLMRESAQQ